MSTVRINLSPGDQSMHLNDEDISNNVARIDIQAIAGRQPRVTVDLAVTGRINVEGKTEVFMSLSTQNLLRRAGWTPPEGNPHGELNLPTAAVEPTTGGDDRG